MTSCIPLSVAKTHNLKISKVDEDEPDMKSYTGSGMKVVGQTKFYIKIKTRKGYTSKKLLHCLVVNHSYDREILISWDNCILFGIIPENCQTPNFCYSNRKFVVGIIIVSPTTLLYYSTTTAHCAVLHWPTEKIQLLCPHKRY